MKCDGCGNKPLEYGKNPCFACMDFSLPLTDNFKPTFKGSWRSCSGCVSGTKLLSSEPCCTCSVPKSMVSYFTPGPPPERSHQEWKRFREAIEAGKKPMVEVRGTGRSPRGTLWK